LIGILDCPTVIHSIGLLITLLALALHILLVVVVLALLLSYLIHCLQNTVIDLELGITTPRV
jgi:hypothetical protein